MSTYIYRYFREIMKTKFFTMALLLTMSLTATATAFENPQTKEETEAARMEAYRQRIGLDYSMPDYHTRKFDASLMGERLAKMLRNLDEHKDQPTNRQAIAGIICRQTDNLDFCTVKKFKILDVEKQGDTITIGIKAWLEPNGANISTKELDLVFVKGVSENTRVNDLFVSLSNYIKQ